MKRIFGPVPSRRLGFSLGVDLVPYKTCSLDCVYCQLGPTPETTLERKEYEPVKEILSELKEVLKEGGRIDWITLSGSGEPTLNREIGALIPGIKKLTSIPVAVLTNGTLLAHPEVREALAFADLVVPSLDAGIEGTFERVNRPHRGISLDGLTRGIAAFTAGFRGRVWLEVMLLRDLNSSGKELEALARRIRLINPEKVQLNTAVRPPAEAGVGALDEQALEEARRFLQSRVEPIPVEVVAGFQGRREEAVSDDVEAAVLAYLKRRPATPDDLSAVFGLHRNEIIKYLGHLLDEGMIKEEYTGSEKYYIKLSPPLEPGP
ncbi:MAG: radical SAM protein [PVC group bacterium]